MDEGCWAAICYRCSPDEARGFHVARQKGVDTYSLDKHVP